MDSGDNKDNSEKGKKQTAPNTEIIEDTAAVPNKEKDHPHKENNPPNDLNSKLITWFTGTMAVCYIILTIIAFYQFSDARKQMGRTDVLSRKSIELADSSIRLTQRIADANNASTETEERAYITVVDIVPTTTDNSTIMSIKVVYKNVGKTPAYIIDGICVSVISAELPDCKKFYKAFDVHKTTARSTVGMEREFNEISTTPIMNETVQSLIKNGDDKIYILGCIKYRDIFHKQHFTHLCAVYMPKVGSFGVIGDYNDAN